MYRLRRLAAGDALTAARGLQYDGCIREPATSTQARDAGSDLTLSAESRSAFELLTRAAAQLAPLGGVAEVEPTRARIGALLARDHACVEIAGAQRSEVIDTLLGAHVLAPRVAASTTIRFRHAEKFDFEARWPDGRSERLEPDEQATHSAALIAVEAKIVRAAEELQAASQRLDDAARSPAQAAGAIGSVARADAAGQPEGSAQPAQLPRSWFRRWLARFAAWVRALFGAKQPSLATPPPAPPALPLLPAPTHRLELEAELAGKQARFDTLCSSREELRRLVETYQAERTARGHRRLVALTTSVAPSWKEIDVDSPDVPAGLVLVLRPSERDREPPDATLFSDARVPVAPLLEDRPTYRVEQPLSRPSLLRQLELIRQQRIVAIARRIVAALCSCRNAILDLVERARAASEQRTRELAARRLDEIETLRREESNAQLPIARRAEEIVQAAATRLEALLREVRAAWQARIDSCAGVEQLRGEVAAIEDGAAHRLALVCDELREAMTIAFVRLVLELAQPLRQELMHKRVEVARGRSSKLEQSFDDVRITLPASLDKTFGALTTPDIGELIDNERSVFDPLFRTLAREKRTCVARLAARLDDIERTTTRELYAAAVFVSPLVAKVFKGLAAELIAAHQRWIDALVSDEQLAWEQERARHAPALALVAPLEAAEGKLTALLEQR